MDAAEVFQSFPCRPHAAFFDILKALPDSFNHVSLRRNVEQVLISFGVLHNGFRSAIDGENQGSLGFLEMLHELDGIAPECRHRLNVFLDVEHTHLTSK
jgi:hypothetical protein